ncbi:MULTISPECIES: hypothetical protein [unclassified Paenibacillus]|uniref:hypothetical protein n=1 Tax=unclassified Paenibacillus TaxID=185978 RepID=UPI0015A1E40B|nr:MULTISPECIES: hypothetical protein [unclassified Paenibacillus]
MPKRPFNQGLRRQLRLGAAHSSDHRYNQFEVSPTLPGPGDKQRQEEVSIAIADYKASRVKVR